MRFFQGDMVAEGAVDEAHRPGTDPAGVGGVVGGGDQLRVVGQRQVGVGVHPQKTLLLAQQANSGARDRFPGDDSR